MLTTDQSSVMSLERAACGGTAFVFPGHALRWNCLGDELFDQVPEFRSQESRIDAVLGYSLRRRLAIPDAQLHEVRFGQPALFLLNALHYYKVVRESERPDFVAGHGLGEYNALLAAEAFDLMTGLRLVQRRSELIAAAVSGSMAAVIGLEPLQVAELLQTDACANLDVAYYNSPSQTTVAGLRGDIYRASLGFERAGAQMYLPLDIRVPLHSRYLHQAAEQFAEFMQSVEVSSPRVTVISNVTAEPYPQDSPNEVKRLLKRHITLPVNWIGTVRYLMSAGVTTFKEVGPDNLLTRLFLQFRH